MAGRDDERDFGEILAEFESAQAAGGLGQDPEPGARVSGRILAIGEEDAVVDLGAKSDGVVARAELTGPDGELTAATGDRVEGVVVGRDERSGALRLRVRPGAGAGAADAALALEEIAQAHAHAIPVEGTVAGAVKGGVEVVVSGVRAFCPVSQLERGFVEDPAAYAGSRFMFRVVRFEPAGRGGRPNVVLSRRELLEEEERRRREEALARLAEGAVVRGTVTSVTGYGAFVDLGGIEGLLHVSEMAHERVERPSDLLAEGDSIEVKVLAIEQQEGAGGGKDRRISLSRRALEQDPWEDAARRFPEGETFPGRVMRLEPYGAFVRLAPGLEGLVHVSELAPGGRIAHPREVVGLGEDVEVRVLRVEPDRRRISLAPAALAETAPAEDPALAEDPGAAAESPSGFGSMADFFDRSKRE